jgi:hypothetical protein
MTNLIYITDPKKGKLTSLISTHIPGIHEDADITVSVRIEVSGQTPVELEHTTTPQRFSESFPRALSLKASRTADQSREDARVSTDDVTVTGFYLIHVRHYPYNPVEVFNVTISGSQKDVTTELTIATERILENPRFMMEMLGVVFGDSAEDGPLVGDL